jgi:hypothetical protein
VARQGLSVLVARILRLIFPQLHLAIAAARHKPSRVAGCISACGDDLSRRNSGRPAHAIDTLPARLEFCVRPGVVFELKDGDVAVGGGTGEQAAGLVWCPGDEVYGGGVEGDLVDLLP